MNERDMMQYSYCGGYPGNMLQYNFGFQGPPGSLNNMNSMNNMGFNNNMNDPLIQISNRISSLENRVRLLEQRLGTSNNYQDDNSMYML